MTLSNQVPQYSIETIKKKASDFCVLIPVINEGDRIHSQLKDMSQKNISQYVDIIIADGGSTDGSLSRDFLAQTNCTALLIKNDVGKLSAQLRMGFNFCLNQGYNGVITMDGNNKDGVEAVEIFIQKLKEKHDFIQGSRFIEGGKAINTPLIRHLGIKLLHAPFISLMAKFKYTDTTNGFRGFSAHYLKHPEVDIFREVFQSYELLAYLSVRASQLNLNCIEVPVTRKYPKNMPAPTKINGFCQHLNLIKILLYTFLKKYHPTVK